MEMVIGIVLLVLFVAGIAIELIGALYIWLRMVIGFRHEPGIVGALIGLPSVSIGFWGIVFTGAPFFQMLLPIGVALMVGGLHANASWTAEMSSDSLISES